MLLSMTGFGETRHQDDRMSVSVEVRTVNNRYLKLSIKCADVYGAFEGEIEKIAREYISRGTVMVAVRVERVATAADVRLNEMALQTLSEQLQGLAAKMGDVAVGPLTDLLALPNAVIDDSKRNIDIDADWKIIQDCLHGALKNLQLFREEEGRSMREDLLLQKEIIAKQLQKTRERAPLVVSEYREKILDRVRKTLAETDAKVDETNLIRDVSIFSDRADINEEIARLECHLDQLAAFLNEKSSSGRKLEFLSQEMFREINTIGSKANDVQIAHSVVEMKAAIEKMREMLQNIE
ncbi:YicC/YloC family endoribonuclease [Symmachiella macrocystis]|nr:YicC/YloC family endoribonuclease [Symmachiella macrocystis]